jgi:hypothetical protein
VRANRLETILASLLPNFEPGFDTPEEAIAFSKWIAAARGNENIASCIGRVIRLADWRDDGIFLQLDNGKTLHFGCARYVVDLAVEDGVPSNSASTLRGPGAVLVRFGDGEAFYWDRAELIRALEGNSIRRIEAGQTIFLLYVSNVGILMISVLINRSTGRPFLFWEMTD